MDVSKAVYGRHLVFISGKNEVFETVVNIKIDQPINLSHKIGLGINWSGYTVPYLDDELIY